LHFTYLKGIINIFIYKINSGVIIAIVFVILLIIGVGVGLTIFFVRRKRQQESKTNPIKSKDKTDTTKSKDKTDNSISKSQNISKPIIQGNKIIYDGSNPILTST
jgi:uncharacterized protein YneF (UPF0154 family)